MQHLFSKFFAMQLNKYAMYGVLFGFLFPLGAICLLLWSSGEWTFQQIGLIHDQNTLLWIIDTAPIFLGIFAAFGGYQKDKLERAVSRHEGLSLQRGKVLDSAFDGVIMLDKLGCVINFNKTCEAIFGYCKAEILGHKMADFIFPENSRDQYHQALTNYVATGEQVVLNKRIEIEGLHKNGHVFPIEIVISPIKIANTIMFSAFIRDITERNKEKERYYQAAFMDELTGLPNRRYFIDFLKKRLTLEMSDDQVGTLFFIDLNRFKLVNDSLGHHIGDELLQIIAQRLSLNIREGDLVCRLGGDEFLVLLASSRVGREKATKDAKVIAQGLVENLSKLMMIGKHKVGVLASVGICHFHRGDCVDDVLIWADSAMYQAKKNSLNSVAVYTKSMHKGLMKQMKIIESLDEAVFDEQFFMLYQLQYNQNNDLVGAEALIRWQHPRLGLLPPGIFISLAEQHSRMEAIGIWVLESVFKQITAWKAEGLELPKVSINISVKQLMQDDFVNMLNSLSNKYNVFPNAIILEVTESISLEDFNSLQEKFVKLVNQGYRFSLDDFGTGYASMTNFKRMPFSQAKVDQSFITDIATNEDNLAFTQAIIAMAKTFGMEVVAEGVETDGQHSILMALGCDQFQGYLFSKPVQPKELTRLIKS